MASSLLTTLQQRRLKLASRFDRPAILWSGRSPSRNFPANRYPFRASSHFLYFAGRPLDNAALFLDQGKLELFIDDPAPGSALWHGPTPSKEEIAATIAADAVFPLADLKSRCVGDVATIAVCHPQTYQQQCQLLGRGVGNDPNDLDLTHAIISLRLTHDEEAIAQLRSAAAVTIQAHLAGMKATPEAKTEAEVRAAMEGVIIAHNMSCAYNSIVTIQGEVLHNEVYHHPLGAKDLLLADVGAETSLGWAADVTRTWPVKGKFSSTQRDLYEVVLAAHDACIDKLKPGVEYADIHLLAATIIAQGLVDLGILLGNVSDLVSTDAYALFFPHGIGHLLGLDVHDMEDLGDIAGYESGRVRSDRFGLCYLRLNRPLRAGMLVTIEPGFYQVPGILFDPTIRAKYQGMVNWDRLNLFADVRGIRIEDDVLVTAEGFEVLTADLPNDASAIEEVMENTL